MGSLTALPWLDAVALTERAGVVLQIQIEYVILPPGHTFDRLRMTWAVTQTTPGGGVAVGLGELDSELVGVLDGCVLGFWLGVDVVLCDGLGVTDGLGVLELAGFVSPASDRLRVWTALAWLRATAENTAVDPAAHGEWEDLACHAGTTDTASAGASTEPDNKNIPPAIKTATRPARAILVGTAALR